MSFSQTKNRLFSIYESISAWLARRPLLIRRAVYSVFGAVMWGVYLLPGNQVRPTLKALTKHIGASSPAEIYPSLLPGKGGGLNMSFSQTKNRLFSIYESISAWLARRPL